MLKTRVVKEMLRVTAAAAISLLVAFSASAQTIRYVHTDGLGSVVLTTDKDRNIVDRSEYEPYGSLLNRPVADGPGYAGHVMDATTGLTYMQQRYYDPQVGRFLSIDQVMAYEKPIANFNRYLYGLNNPYLYRDPDGRDVTCAMGVCHIHSANIGEFIFKDFPNYAAITARTSALDAAIKFTQVMQKVGSVVYNQESNTPAEGRDRQGVRELGDLEPTHAPDHPQNDPEIAGLSDRELGESINNPINGDRITVRGNRVLDGNTRINEAKGRGWPDSTEIPVDELPERPDNLDQDPLGPYRGI